MKQFSYQGISKLKQIITQVTGIAGILFSTFFAIVTLAGVWIIPRGDAPVPIINDPRVTLICFAVWFLLTGWSLGFIFINFLPTVWINDDGIQISAFLFFRININWNDIVDIDKGRIPGRYTLIRTRRISPFHRLYGWLYSISFYPSFVLSKDIEEYQQLISEIRKRIGRPI